MLTLSFMHSTRPGPCYYKPATTTCPCYHSHTRLHCKSIEVRHFIFSNSSHLIPGHRPHTVRIRFRRSFFNFCRLHQLNSSRRSLNYKCEGFILKYRNLYWQRLPGSVLGVGVTSFAILHHIDTLCTQCGSNRRIEVELPSP